METWVALIAWLVIFILVLLVSRHYRISTWSAIALATLIALIVMSIVKPPTELDIRTGMNGWGALYWLVMFLSPILLVIYIISAAIKDRRPKVEATEVTI